MGDNAEERRGPTRRLVAAAITEFAAGRRGTLLALATHGRTGLARMTMGSVSMGIVRHATVPVLVVRPPDVTDPM